ncbi:MULTISPECIES: DsbA family protein [Bacteria]|uniref:DsbA family protein n=1 Tax=Bacteria TaxID=2 RepID=UPI003C7BDA28
MKTSLKVTIVTASLVVVLVLAGVLYVMASRSAEGGGAAAPSAPPQLMRDDSHVLDDGGEGAVTVVEFLDFECEACGAFFPIVESLRDAYKGKITYVVRYFPLPGHVNSVNAALAAEAAARQGRFEDMYRRLFETQRHWGEATASRADTFRGYAQDLGLDMAAYDQAVASPETQARVLRDREEGRALGVDSTPTFFIDGQRADLKTWGDLEASIRKALDARS